MLSVQFGKQQLGPQAGWQLNGTTAFSWQRVSLLGPKTLWAISAVRLQQMSQELSCSNPQAWLAEVCCFFCKEATNLFNSCVGESIPRGISQHPAIIESNTQWTQRKSNQLLNACVFGDDFLVPDGMSSPWDAVTWVLCLAQNGSELDSCRRYT